MSNMLRPISIPDGVEVSMKQGLIEISGPLGNLTHTIPAGLSVEEDNDGRLKVGRKKDDRKSRSMHGLHRTLLANKVEGVKEGFKKDMEIHGTGYSVTTKGSKLVLKIGFCHDVEFELPKNIEVEVEQEAAQPDNPARFTVKGIDKEKLGQFVANIRDVRPPEPYKGKGIRYADERVRRKEGKAFAGLE